MGHTGTDKSRNLTSSVGAVDIGGSCHLSSALVPVTLRLYYTFEIPAYHSRLRFTLHVPTTLLCLNTANGSHTTTSPPSLLQHILRQIVGRDDNHISEAIDLVIYITYAITNRQHISFSVHDLRSLRSTSLVNYLRSQNYIYLSRHLNQHSTSRVLGNDVGSHSLNLTILRASFG